MRRRTTSRREASRFRDASSRIADRVVLHDESFGVLRFRRSEERYGPARSGR